MDEKYEKYRFKYYGNEKSELEAFYDYILLKQKGILKFYEINNTVFARDIENNYFINGKFITKDIFIRSLKNMIRQHKIERILINIC